MVKEREENVFIYLLGGYYRFVVLRYCVRVVGEENYKLGMFLF